MANVIGQLRYIICWSVSHSVSLSANRYRGKTAEWIRMALGMVGKVGICSGILDFGGDCRREGAVLEVLSPH